MPFGKVLPSGWLADQLGVQANGLIGHQHEFLPYVAQTTWLNRGNTYTDLEEAGSYWFHGFSGTALLTQSRNMIQRAEEFLNFVLANSDQNGWIGPEVFDANKKRYLWGR